MKSLPIALSDWSQVSSSITPHTARCLWPLCPPRHLLCPQFSLVDFYVRSPRSGSGFSDCYFLHHGLFSSLLSGQSANTLSDSLQPRPTSSTPAVSPPVVCSAPELLLIGPSVVSLLFYLLSSSFTPSCKCLFIHLFTVSSPVERLYEGECSSTLFRDTTSALAWGLANSGCSASVRWRHACPRPPAWIPFGCTHTVWSQRFPNFHHPGIAFLPHSRAIGTIMY